MKITKTQWIIIAVLAGIAIWYFFLRNKQESKYGKVGVIPRTPKARYNLGQMCQRDKQCGGNLKCVKGSCQEVITTPIVPVTPPVTPKPVIPRPIIDDIGTMPISGGITPISGGITPIVTDVITETRPLTTTTTTTTKPVVSTGTTTFNPATTLSTTMGIGTFE